MRSHIYSHIVIVLLLATKKQTNLHKEIVHVVLSQCCTKTTDRYCLYCIVSFLHENSPNKIMCIMLYHQ